MFLYLPIKIAKPKISGYQPVSWETPSETRFLYQTHKNNSVPVQYRSQSQFLDNVLTKTLFKYTISIMPVRPFVLSWGSLVRIKISHCLMHLSKFSHRKLVSITHIIHLQCQITMDNPLFSEISVTVFVHVWQFNVIRI
jgi:hypothetical protein